MKKNIFKTIVALTLLCIMSVNGIAIYISANDISPRYTNCDFCDVTFNISSSGLAYTDVTYLADGETFTQAKLSVEIQKRNLLFFWTTVEIGVPDNVWTGYCTDISGEIYYNLQLLSKGTYRAIITVEFMGTTGVVDTINETIEAQYS